MQRHSATSLQPARRGWVRRQQAEGTACGHASQTRQGYVERDGVKVGYEVFGDRASPPCCCCRPGRSCVPRSGRRRCRTSRGTARVITFDPRGNGRSDHPRDADGVRRRGAHRRCSRRTGCDRHRRQAVLVSVCSRGNGYALRLAADHPERVLGWVALGPYIFGLGSQSTPRDEAQQCFDRDLGVDEGWTALQPALLAARPAWFRGVLLRRAAAGTPLHEADRGRRSPGRWTSSRRLIVGDRASNHPKLSGRTVGLASRVQCPVLVVHGTDDRAVPAG